MQRRRIGAYGLCRDGERMLLTRVSPAGAFPGVWRLPGGAVGHAEHPDETVVRELAAQTGLSGTTAGVRAVVSDVIALAGCAVHTDRLVYDVRVPVQAASPGPGGMIDRVRWLLPAELAGLPLMPFTAEVLGVPTTPLPAGRADQPPLPPQVPDRGQRFGAYAVATDPAGRVLLTRIASGYPGAGRWHLPGGGTDHGEQPVTGLLRELVEETGQLGRVGELIAVNDSHNPRAMGPDGRPIDWHVVRAIYRVAVDTPTAATVTEAAGGSTAEAAWFPIDETADLALTQVAAEALRRIGT